MHSARWLHTWWTSLVPRTVASAERKLIHAQNHCVVEVRTELGIVLHHTIFGELRRMAQTLDCSDRSSRAHGVSRLGFDKAMQVWVLCRSLFHPTIALKK